MSGRVERSGPGAGDERGVSEVLGYVLLFALVVSVIGVASTTGVGELEERRAENRLANAERAFGILDRNVDDIVYGDATSRSTTVDAAGGEVDFGDPVRFNLTLQDEGVSYGASVRPLAYRAGDSELRYVNGAVIRTEPAGSVMLREPPMVFDGGTVVPYVRTRPAGARSVGGETAVRVRTSAASRTAYVRSAAAEYDVRLNVTTPRTGVWRDYLSETADATCTTADGTVSCAFTTDRVAVSLVRLDVRLGG